ncbi:hypothetical protein [Rhizobacter sp. SG703]|uniref:hypothetical protein n=1 Tax=Rhizobacter sp. SG703 TaxID=2587140 RepID=UPI001446C6DE|nr:hypothetical protein [Rhizobacter sp. SG703]NKI97521.1 hypothetical protein [Rhizobacter sp. SG703]
MQYTFEVQAPGASPVRIARAVASVLKFFADAGLSPYAAALAAQARERWDDDGFPDEGQLTDAQLDAAELWDEVPDLLRAGCYGRTTDTPSINFRLVNLDGDPDL